VSVLLATLERASTDFADRTALAWPGGTLGYEDLRVVVEEVAGGLAAHGVGPGQLVALSLPSGPEYVIAYLAAARLGAAVTGINPRFVVGERWQVVQRAVPDLVVATPALVEGLEDHRTLLVDTLDLTRPPEPDADPRATLLRDLRPAGPRSAPWPPPPPSDPAAVETVVFTSGTTGTPKGATFTSAQIAAITAGDTGGSWGHGGAQLVATGLPHVGFMTKLAGLLQAGATMHLLPRWRAADALTVIARERIRYVGGVAAQVSLLLGVPDFDRHDLSAVEGLIVGGGPSPAALVAAARARFGAGYSVRYSSTESGGLGTMTAFDAPDAETLETVGRPRPGTEVAIRGTDGAVLPAGEVGRICLRSGTVMAGYWNDPEATAASLDDGWLLTDDLGWVGDDGCLRVSGRLTEMYIRGGYNVFPQEVESALLHHPAVASVAVAPRPSEVMGEVGVAVVVPRPGAEPPTAADLRSFAADRLAAYKLPEDVVVVDALPLTSMDKLDRRALARLVDDT
jgi:acyl-CoA synthetase (AMP-forming)/AMP-acid ligase II